MKKIILFLLCLAMLTIFVGCSAVGGGIPPLGSVAKMNRNILKKNVIGQDMDLIRQTWGEPDRSDEKYSTDIWMLDESGQQLVVVYNADGVVSDCLFAQ